MFQHIQQRRKTLLLEPLPSVGCIKGVHACSDVPCILGSIRGSRANGFRVQNLGSVVGACSGLGFKVRGLQAV